MKTASEVAEEVRLLAKNCIGECGHLPHGACLPCLTQALTAYAEERVAIAVDNAIGNIHAKQSKMFNPLLALHIRAEALEEAAKVALLSNLPEASDAVQEGWIIACEYIAKELRALKEKP